MKWPASVLAIIGVLLLAAFITLVAAGVPRAVGVYAAIFPWILVLPIDTWTQLSGALFLHLVVWITAFVDEKFWVLFGLLLAANGLFAVGARKAGASFKYGRVPNSDKMTANL